MPGKARQPAPQNRKSPLLPLNLKGIRTALDRLRKLIADPPTVKTHCTVDGRVLPEDESPSCADGSVLHREGLGVLRLLCPSGFSSIYADIARDIDTATALPRPVRIQLRKLAAFCRQLVEDPWHPDAVDAPDESLALLDDVGAVLTEPPLTDTERAVLAVIPRSPNARTGKELIAALAARGTDLQQSTLTRHILPRLKKWHGVTNRPGAGYSRP